MRRREFNILLGTVLAWPTLASAQPQPTKVPRIGYLMERSGPGLFDEATASYQRFTFGYCSRSTVCHSKRDTQGQIAMSATE